MTGAVPPREWWISRVCEEFHCTPSQALQEDAWDVLNILELRQYARAYGAVMRPDSTEESLQKEGIPDAFVRLVMANIEASGDQRSH